MPEQPEPATPAVFAPAVVPTSAGPRATLIPCLRYRDAPAAIDWLCHTLGFERQAVYANPDGSIAHAQLVLGNGMVMLGSASDKGSVWGRSIRQPDEMDGINSQGCYVIVADADAVYARAQAAGAPLLLDIRDEDYGGRGFTCRDPEGHLWSVGTYDPWATPPDPPAEPEPGAGAPR